MIRPEQVFLTVKPLDMRWGTERLSQHVQQWLGRSPCDGTAYAFTNRGRTRPKLLVWDGTGVWLCQRASAHWALSLASTRRRHPSDRLGRMAMASGRCRLATTACSTTGALERVMRSKFLANKAFNH